MSLCTLTHDFFVIAIACKSSKSVFFFVNGSCKIKIFFNETNLLLLNDFIFLLTSSSPLIRPRPFKRIKSSLACHFSLVDYPVSHWNTYYSNKQGCDLLIYVDFKHTSWLGVLIGRGKISVIFASSLCARASLLCESMPAIAHIGLNKKITFAV